MNTTETYLTSGYGTVFSIYTDGGGAHAITCWGYNYDAGEAAGPGDNDRYIGVWVTDSDDQKGAAWGSEPPQKLRYYEVAWDTNDNRWELQNYGGGNSWFISRVEAIEQRPTDMLVWDGTDDPNIITIEDNGTAGDGISQITMDSNPTIAIQGIEVIQIWGHGGNDTIRFLSIDSDSSLISLEVHGQNGDDNLSVRFNSGNPIPGLGIEYSGGSGTDDLEIRGGSCGDVMYNMYDSNSGRIIYDQTMIEFSGIEPILDTVSSSILSVYLTSGDDTVSISDGATPILGISDTTIISGATFESIEFANKTNVEVNGLDGVDEFTVNIPNPADGLSTLKIYGNESTDGVINPDDDADDDLYIDSLGSGTTLELHGQGGEDEFDFGRNNDSLGFILSPVLVEGGTNGTTGGGGSSITVLGEHFGITHPSGDIIRVNDDADTTGRTYNFNDGTFQRVGTGLITYNDCELLSHIPSTGNNDVNVIDTPDSMQFYIKGGPGQDDIDVTMTGEDCAINIQAGGEIDRIDVWDTGDETLIQATGDDGNDFITVHTTGEDGGVDMLGSAGIDTLTAITNGSGNLLKIRGYGERDYIYLKGCVASSYVEIRGGDGADYIELGNDSDSMDDLLGTIGVFGDGDIVNGTHILTIDGDSNALDLGDDLVLTDDGETDPITYSINEDEIDRTGIPTIGYDLIERVSLVSTSDEATITIIDTPDGTVTEIGCASENDEVTVTMTGADSNVAITLGEGTRDECTIDGSGPDGSDANSFGAFIRIWGEYTFDTNPGGDVFNQNDCGAVGRIEYRGFGEKDSFFPRGSGTSSKTVMFGGDGNDYFLVSNGLPHQLDDLLGDVFIYGEGNIFDGTISNTITGGTGSKTVVVDKGDSVVIEDTGTTAGGTYTIDDTSFVRAGGPSIEFSGLEELRFYTSPFTDSVSIGDTIDGSYTLLNSDEGNDSISVTTTGDDGILSISGMLGNDDITVNGTGNSNVLVMTVGNSATVNDTHDDAGIHLTGAWDPDDTFIINGVGSNAVVKVEGYGANDVLTVDYSTPGDPISTNGMTYDGGNQTGAPGDSLVINGGTFSKIEYDFYLATGPEGHDGLIYLDTDLIEFMGLEPIYNYGTAADMEFYLKNDAANGDHAIFEDYGIPTDGLNQLRSVSNTFEDTVFTNPTNRLDVYTLAGDDTVEMLAPDQGFGPNQAVFYGGAGNDFFQLEATNGSGDYFLYGDGDNDTFFLGADTATMDDISTNIVMIGGTGTDNGILADSNSAIPDPAITVTNLSVTGIIPGLITYSGLETINIDPSDLLPVTVTIESTASGTATELDSGSNGDEITIGYNGTLDNILGPLTIDDTWGAGPDDTLTYDDSGDSDSATYSLTSNGSLTRTGGTAIPPITVQGVMETVNLLAGTGPNTIDVDPSMATTFFIDGEAPTSPLPADILSIDLTGITDVEFEVIPSQLGMFGTLNFGDGHQPISFIRIETFDFMNGVIDLIVREDKSHDGFLNPALPPGSGFADDGTPDSILLVLDESGPYFVVNVNGIHQIAVTVGDGVTDGLAFCRVIGSTDDDTLVVDWDDGNPIPEEGIHFDGGSEVAGDDMILQNGFVGTVTHNFLGPHDGTVVVDSRVITYTGLEPILDLLYVVHRVFNFGAAADEVFIQDSTTPGLTTISSTSSSETVDFASPQSMMEVNLAGGDDVLTIGDDDPSLVPGFAEDFTAILQINGDGGWDTINVRGPVGTPLDPIGWLEFNVEMANLFQPMFSPDISGECLIVNVWYPGLIQNALDVAHETDGCLITVYPGTYPENLTSWKPDIHLRSNAGMAVTMITAATDHIIDLAPFTTGFTLGGAYGEGFTLMSTGAVFTGVTGRDLVDLNISYNHFKGPGMDFGIWISGVTASDQENDSLIRKNTFDDCGTAIAIFSGFGVTDLTISMNCIFNSLNHGILFAKSGGPKGDIEEPMKVVVITENTISNSGIGIYILPFDNLLVDFFVIRLNNFLNNDIGILNETGRLLTALRNYWGAVDGPEASLNPNGIPNPVTGYGTGNPIQDYVLAEDWLTIIHHPSPCDLSIILTAGWNLISIMVELDDLGGAYTASIFASEMNSQAGEDIIKYVVAYDNATGLFEEFVVDSGIGNDFPMEYGRAYYVYSTSPFQTVFHVVGDCPVYETFDLNECWNLIGWMSMQTMDVGEFADMVDHHAGWFVVQAIVKYDDSYSYGEDEYIAWYPGMPDDLFQLMPGEAYWIFSATEMTEVAYP
jgi:hypothetical protein